MRTAFFYLETSRPTNWYVPNVKDAYPHGEQHKDASMTCDRNKFPGQMFFTHESVREIPHISRFKMFLFVCKTKIH